MGVLYLPNFKVWRESPTKTLYCEFWLQFFLPTFVLAASDSTLKTANWFQAGIIGLCFMDTANGFNQGRVNMVNFQTRMILSQKVLSRSMGNTKGTRSFKTIKLKKNIEKRVAFEEFWTQLCSEWVCWINGLAYVTLGCAIPLSGLEDVYGKKISDLFEVARNLSTISVHRSMSNTTSS